MRNEVSGRTREVNRSNSNTDSYDELMKQIDEFRVKAEQIKGIMENKTKKAQQLQLQIDKRQNQMDEITNKAEKELNLMLNRAENQMQQVEQTLVSDFANSYNQITDELLKEVHRATDSVNSIDELIQEKFDTFSAEMVEQFHEEISKCIMNTNNFANDMDDQMNGLAKQYIVKRSNKLTIIVLLLTLLNSFGIIALFLYLTGIFTF